MGAEEQGVRYPGEEMANVVSSGKTICSNVTETNCTFEITESADLYTLCLTLSNDVGESNPVSLSFTRES